MDIKTTNMFKKLSAILSEEILCDNPRDTIYDPDKDLVKDFFLDDLDEVELIMGIEDEFDTNIDDNDATNLHTLRDYYNLLEKRGYDPETCEKKKKEC